MRAVIVMLEVNARNLTDLLGLLVSKVELDGRKNFVAAIFGQGRDSSLVSLFPEALKCRPDDVSVIGVTVQIPALVATAALANKQNVHRLEALHWLRRTIGSISGVGEWMCRYTPKDDLASPGMPNGYAAFRESDRIDPRAALARTLRCQTEMLGDAASSFGILRQIIVPDAVVVHAMEAAAPAPNPADRNKLRHSPRARTHDA
jgi:hypothetical protein